MGALRKECTCTGCNRCKPAGGPCARGVVEESYRRCRECHEHAGELLWIQLPESEQKILTPSRAKHGLEGILPLGGERPRSRTLR